MDWKLDHIGNPNNALYFNKQVYVTSDQGVIASLNVKDGSIEWRHLMVSYLMLDIIKYTNYIYINFIFFYFYLLLRFFFFLTIYINIH